MVDELPPIAVVRLPPPGIRRAFGGDAGLSMDGVLEDVRVGRKVSVIVEFPPDDVLCQVPFQEGQAVIGEVPTVSAVRMGARGQVEDLFRMRVRGIAEELALSLSDPRRFRVTLEVVGIQPGSWRRLVDEVRADRLEKLQAVPLPGIPSSAKNGGAA